MFDIAWTELLVVAVIAIIVVGPKELPGMLRAFGKTFGQVRRTAREFQNTFSEALREAEREANLDEVRQSIDSVRKIDPARDLKKSLGEAKGALNETVSDARNTRPDVVPLKGEGKSATAASADGAEFVAETAPGDTAETEPAADGPTAAKDRARIAAAADGR